MGQDREGCSLYTDVTGRIVAELEAGRLPWVQPWDSAACACTLPCNAATGRRYSGINILLLWDAVITRGYADQRWLTFRQAQALGGSVRRGEKGTSVVYADRFTPKAEAERAGNEDRDPRTVAFLKRFTVFNVDQCDGLPEVLTSREPPLPPAETIPHAETLIAATGATVRIGGDHAFYAPVLDTVQLPPHHAFRDQINFYRTALHELGHWTGHSSRLDRDQKGAFGSPAYANEELVAELTAAFTCASLHIHPRRPTLRRRSAGSARAA